MSETIKIRIGSSMKHELCETQAGDPLVRLIPLPSALCRHRVRLLRVLRIVGVSQETCGLR